MRLSCPNCGAQYEVPVEVIPENGRDVQCSNCGHTWFQVHPDHDAEMSADLGASAPDEGWTPNTPAPTQDTAQDAPGDIDETEVQPPEMAFDEAQDDIASAVHSVVGDHGEDTTDRPEGTAPDEDDDDDQDASPSPRPRRKIDPEVIGVLREEAEHEAKLRAHRTDGDLEIQPDLGLDSPASPPMTDPRANEARARMRRIRGQSDEIGTDDFTETSESEHHATRRNLLPDIDEINSTLRSTDEPSRENHPVVAMNTRRRRRVGFRLGFGFTMLAAAFVLLAYVYNKEIIAAWPAGEPYVIAFVEKMNALRLWLDGQMTTAMLWLDEKAAAAGGNLGDDIGQ